MMVLFFGLSFFCIAFILHFFIWKIHIPKCHTKILLLIFFGTLTIGLFMLWIILKLNTIDYMHIAVFFTSLALAYIANYSAIEVDSPSLLITKIIGYSGAKGVSKEELLNVMTDDTLLKPRVRDLVEDKLIDLDMDKYKLTLRGRLLARTFIFFFKLFNSQKG